MVSLLLTVYLAFNSLLCDVYSISNVVPYPIITTQNVVECVGWSVLMFGSRGWGIFEMFKLGFKIF